MMDRAVRRSRIRHPIACMWEKDVGRLWWVWILFSWGRHGPLARYVKLRFAHAPGMPGTFSPPPRVSNPDMHHGTCVTHVPWCMSGSLTRGFLWSRWRGKRSRHYRRMCNLQFYVSGKRPIAWIRFPHYWSFLVLTGYQWPPLTKGKGCGAMMFSSVSTNLLNKQWTCWWIETPWRLRDVIVLVRWWRGQYSPKYGETKFPLDEIFFTDCTGSCHFDNFQCSKW